MIRLKPFFHLFVVAAIIESNNHLDLLRSNKKVTIKHEYVLYKLV